MIFAITYCHQAETTATTTTTTSSEADSLTFLLTYLHCCTIWDH